jgi:hypothetical protein
MSALECTHNGCTEGEGGARFKTPALAPQNALEYLKLPMADKWLVPEEAPTKPGSLRFPDQKSISGGCSQEDFKFFTRKWNQYVRSSNVTEDFIEGQALELPQ